MRSMAVTRYIVLAAIVSAAFAINAHAEPPDIEQARAHKIVAVWHFADKAQMHEAFEEHLDVMEFAYGRWVKFLTDAESLNRLRARGYDIEIETPDIYEFYGSRLAPTGMGGYRTFDEIVMTMDTLHNLNPAISTARFSIGQTLEGREIWVMKISDNPAIDEDEPESFFSAAIHAREVITPAVLLETMRTLIEGYGSDTMITRLIDTREIFFMPCINADGYVYNEIIAPSGGGMWRKNRRDNGDGSFGVDLNRNFPYEWGYDNNGSSPYTGDPTYRGTGPASEPETQRFIDFVEGRNFAITVTYHSYSNLILWPWGYDYNLYTPDQDLFQAMGDSISVFNGYTPTVAWGFYPVNGDTDDWLYGEQTAKDKIFAFTFEVGSYSDGFWPATYRIPQLVAENIPANLFLIDLSVNPYAVAVPLAPEWAVTDTFPTGFFDLTWSQPDNAGEIVSFTLVEFSDPQVGTDGAEEGDDRWSLGGFYNNINRVYEGGHAFYSDMGHNLHHKMTSVYSLHVAPGDTLTFYTWYDIETDWDYAYVEVSTNSQTGFITIPGDITTNYNPHGTNLGNGITGQSFDWQPAKFDLSAFTGEYIYLRFSYVTDGAVAKRGFYLDLISPVAWFEEVTVLAEGYEDSTYSFGGRPMGDYFFGVCATDAEGRTGPFSVVKTVHVESDVLYGDMNNDGAINPLDVVLLVNYVYFSGALPVIPGAQYINGDNECNPLDVTHLVNYVYFDLTPPLGYGE